MTLSFDKEQTYFGSKLVAKTDTGVTYTIENKWDMPRGVGHAVFVRNAVGKSITGNKSAFYTKAINADDAVAWCKNHFEMAA